MLQNSDLFHIVMRAPSMQPPQRMHIASVMKQCSGYEVAVIVYLFIHNCFMCSGRVHDPTSQFSSRPLFVCKFRRQGGTEAF